MEILSLQQINDNIDTFIKNINGFNLKYSALFDTLNKFGFRVGEITSHDRWILTAFPIIEIVTESGGFFILLTLYIRYHGNNTKWNFRQKFR